jgi:hypothetical protein
MVVVENADERYPVVFDEGCQSGGFGRACVAAGQRLATTSVAPVSLRW